MKVGDLVRLRSDNLDEGDFKRTIEESGCGMVVGFKPRGYSRDRDPGCKVWNDAIVLWPDFGIGYNMVAMLKVIDESG